MATGEAGTGEKAALSKLKARRMGERRPSGPMQRRAVLSPQPIPAFFNATRLSLTNAAVRHSSETFKNHAL